ncbi:hypothetical protein MBLNU459_g8447t1 [Dothideomycetes sp. NU459]
MDRATLTPQPTINGLIFLQSTDASELNFLSSWQPVLRYPDQEISMLSPGGYKELYDMGVNYRFVYPSFYKDNTNYTLWANEYQKYVPRVVDSARLFARGYMGPNSSFGDVYVINSTDPRSIANSLAPSDLCPLYKDNSGGANATTWANIYLPPIAARINKLLKGGLQFNSSDVVQFPYLCGFESQITGRRSPWCDVLTDDEIIQYEYAQDIRYWYGSGLGTSLDKNLMLPFLTAVVQRFVDGPNATYHDKNGGAFSPPPLIATFTNDGQINQLAAAIGVFDGQSQLPATRVLAQRTFRSSYFVSMRGTITFERLSCGGSKFMRIKLNDVVYPVPECQSGPGRSCPLAQYQALIAAKSVAAGDFEVACGIANSSVVPAGQEKTTFLTDLSLPFEYVVKP